MKIKFVIDSKYDTEMVYQMLKGRDWQDRAISMEIGSEFGHMEIVTSGRVLPVLLHRSPLRSIKPPRFIQPKPTQDQKPAPKP